MAAVARGWQKVQRKIREKTKIRKKKKRTFDITMDDSVFVKKRESQQDFTDDEADVKFFQWLRPRLFFFFFGSSVGDGKRHIKQTHVPEFVYFHPRHIP